VRGRVEEEETHGWAEEVLTGGADEQAAEHHRGERTIGANQRREEDPGEGRATTELGRARIESRADRGAGQQCWRGNNGDLLVQQELWGRGGEWGKQRKRGG
jgi:hypothetical protein